MTMIKKTIAIATLLAASTGAVAAEVSGNVTLATDYRFRGISQTDDDMALQGGFDVAFENGFYIGTWGSNVDFANSLELDYYAGYTTDLSDTVSIDVGYLYYDYPGTDGDDPYAEVYGSVSFGDFSLGLNYSDDYYFETGEFFYLAADYSMELPEEFGLSFHYGYNSFDEEGTFLADDDNYSDWSISLTKEFAGLEFGLAYVDTNLDEDSGYLDKWIDATAVFSISKSM